MRRRLVVVGAGAAGMSAASAARRVDNHLEVVVLEAGNHAAYGLCGLPYFLSHVVADVDSLRAYPPTYFRDQRDIDLRFGAEVVRIDAERQVVHHRTAGRTGLLHYDKLILTAGATAFLPAVPGLDDDHVFTVRDVAESVRLRGLLDAGHVGHATVVGGGYIGLEVAESLAERGISVTLVEALPRLMANLDPELSQRVQDEVEQHVVVRLNSALSSLVRTDRGLTLRLADGSAIETDVVIVATGVRPASTLGSSIGANTGPGGALLVDEHMRTSVPNVYAAGDCIAPNHIATGRPAFIPLGPTANKTGRVAGTVAAGGSACFAGIAGTAIVKVFGIGVGRTGLTLVEALSEGFDAQATDAVGRSRAKYFPGSAQVDVRLVHTGDGRLLGAQFVGQGDDVAKRVDVTAVALHAGLGVEDLADLDLSYAPPFAPVYEPVLLAANAAVAALKPLRLAAGE
ncbi:MULTISPECIES: FAD-dependent oxidoreductase [unclassified Nocardioides]|uniref:FAD-dependent oxidoreductase n=1 Tax=unclassified Nocardioides TaxID=2615069 RepID=UPI0000571297|nr:MULTISPECIES: FAD-dependent oxidoreductase [unclassified Nocardioides]ABL79424.1 FAD-dependent pyridine nucleotide-disulphide oxidoreductase [Nocardioides sp. JS614]